MIVNANYTMSYFGSFLLLGRALISLPPSILSGRKARRHGTFSFVNRELSGSNLDADDGRLGDNGNTSDIEIKFISAPRRKCVLPNGRRFRV